MKTRKMAALSLAELWALAALAAEGTYTGAVVFVAPVTKLAGLAVPPYVRIGLSNPAFTSGVVYGKPNGVSGSMLETQMFRLALFALAQNQQVNVLMDPALATPIIYNMALK
jgi:hypothetical protein